ncbi:uncharacterized protein [Drosophila takahashii]|uniref:uncharacterized protein n=1 Tax=Drosophila takahashii TaxID=29030 RepID=UPI0038990710
MDRRAHSGILLDGCNNGFTLDKREPKSLENFCDKQGGIYPCTLKPTPMDPHLVIKDAHHATLHGGVQLTLAQTRLRFWIVNGRVATRRMIRGCMQCFRACPTAGKQLMGNLPTHRINPPCRPFWATGIDYTGAIELKAARLRGTATYKGYIAIFICLASKASTWR